MCTSTMPFLISALRTRFSANETHCPASADATRALISGISIQVRAATLRSPKSRKAEHGTYRLRSMDLTTVPWKFPFESGPKSTASPDLTVPELRMPSTTVPTYGTEYTSVIEYCSARQRRRDGVQERKKERKAAVPRGAGRSGTSRGRPRWQGVGSRRCAAAKRDTFDRVRCRERGEYVRNPGPLL